MCLCGVIWLLIHRAIKGNCTQATEHSVSVLQTQKTPSEHFVPCSHFNWGWEKDSEVSSTPGQPTISLLQHWLFPWVTVDGQCHVGHTGFHSSSYARESSSRSVHVIGTVEKPGEKVALVHICLCTWCCFVSMLLGCQLRLSCPLISSWAWLVQNSFWQIEQNVISLGPPSLTITSNFEHLFCEHIQVKTIYRH